MGDSRPAAGRGRVLLIDDDRVFGLWATKVLEARGFEIEHVLDPMTGLRQIESQPWDLVITDVEMPRMSGLEFLERVRRMVPGIPVVVVTAHPTVDRAMTALRQPATDFINKPITAEEFAAKVAALVAQRRAATAKPASVLAIGAHPGDVEIGAGGALLAHRAAGVAVTILTLSPGVAREAGGAEGVAGEAAGGPSAGGAAQALGARLGLADLAAAAGAELSAGSAIDMLIAQTHPTVLYAHSFHDTQPDHRAAHLAAVGAARGIERVYCFQSPSATTEFSPAHFTVIDDHIAGKLAAVAEFAAFPEVRDYLDPDQITSTALYWARYCEGRHAEAFEVVRDLAVTGAAPRGRGTAEAAF